VDLKKRTYKYVYGHLVLHWINSVNRIDKYNMQEDGWQVQGDGRSLQMVGVQQTSPASSWTCPFEPRTISAVEPCPDG